jgi:hypothetical protein
MVHAGLRMGRKAAGQGRDARASSREEPSVSGFRPPPPRHWPSYGTEPLLRNSTRWIAGS